MLLYSSGTLWKAIGTCVRASYWLRHAGQSVVRNGDLCVSTGCWMRRCRKGGGVGVRFEPSLNAVKKFQNVL